MTTNKTKKKEIFSSIFSYTMMALILTAILVIAHNIYKNTNNYYIKMEKFSVENYLTTYLIKYRPETTINEKNIMIDEILFLKETLKNYNKEYVDSKYGESKITENVYAYLIKEELKKDPEKYKHISEIPPETLRQATGMR